MIKQIKQGEAVINISIDDEQLIFFKYFLTRNFYYAITIDNYPFEIFDKNSLLEALYYQIRLITVNDLNWDAIQEGMADAISNFLEFEGICLLFRQGNMLKNKLPNEFETLSAIINSINAHNDKKLVLILNS